MFEIQTNDHHYVAKSVFLGALILVLGITIWTNMFAQRTIKMSLPNDYIPNPSADSKKDIQDSDNKESSIASFS
jgi:hypothetical protein